jgi:hypothetical protein
MPHREHAERATFITRRQRINPLNLTTPRPLDATDCRARFGPQTFIFVFRYKPPNAAHHAPPHISERS